MLINILWYDIIFRTFSSLLLKSPFTPLLMVGAETELLIFVYAELNANLLS